MTELLPEFPYHPDPVATGVVVPSDATCLCCERKRGHIYTGPVYAAEDLTGHLCPWCIADGSAAERFDAHFTGGTSLGDDVPLKVFAAVDSRTPGFEAWQEPQWFFHCGDGAAFRAEGPNYGPERVRRHAYDPACRRSGGVSAVTCSSGGADSPQLMRHSGSARTCARSAGPAFGR